MIPDDEKSSLYFGHGFYEVRHYFQAHVINVLTDHLVKKAINKLEAAG